MPSSVKQCPPNKVKSGCNRREFIAFTAAAAAIPWSRPAFAAEVPKRPQPGAPEEADIKLPADGVMPTRKLGRTGVTVSLLGLGGFHLGLPPKEQTAIRIVRTAIDHGVTFMDNCWDYNDGESQVRMGHALKDGYRKKVFLMTKIDGRTRNAAQDQIDQCLRSFGTDFIDLVQIHEVIRITDPGRVFGPVSRSKLWLRPRRRGRFASLVSPATRARTSISRCSRLLANTDFDLIPFRCRST